MNDELLKLADERINVGSRVKHSAKFIRSLGNIGIWRTEVIGTVVEKLRLPGMCLALVEWNGGGGFSEVNVANLVAIADVYKEARHVEHIDNIPGIVIGSNAYAKTAI